MPTEYGLQLESRLFDSLLLAMTINKSRIRIRIWIWMWMRIILCNA